MSSKLTVPEDFPVKIVEISSNAFLKKIKFNVCAFSGYSYTCALKVEVVELRASGTTS